MARKSMYHVLNAKIAAMHSKLLTDEDYKKLIEMKSPSDIARYLKNYTEYRHFLQNRNPELMNRLQLERMLEEKLVDILSRLAKFCEGVYKDFIKSFYIKYEIAELKEIARHIHVEKTNGNSSNGLSFLKRNRRLRLDKLLSAKTITDLIHALEGSVYYPLLKSLLQEPEDSDKRLFSFEMTLDKAYFIILRENANKLSKQDRLVFKELIGTYIDMINIQLIYRGKKYYRLSPEELFNYSIDEGFRFNYKKILALCYSKNEQEFKNLVAKTPYHFMLKGDQYQDLYMERRMNRYMYFTFRSALNKFTPDISSLLAFLELVEFEIKDLISMIENVRYGMGYEGARKYLIKAI